MKNRPVDQFAVVPPGFEAVCARELVALGFEDVIPATGGVGYRGGLRELYLANLWLRSASRVLVRMGEVVARDFPALYQKAGRLPWGEFIRPGQPLQFRVTSHESRLQHKGRIAETLELAARKSFGAQPLNPELPTQLILVRLDQDRIQFSIDSSGALLHRRGYRKEQGSAPLRENLAAAILLYLDWRPEESLVDPFCGSGTFAIEAALIASHRPPGRKRNFAFMHWPGFRQGLWDQLLNEADRACRCEVAPVILGSDLDDGMLAIARANAEAAGVADMMTWQHEDFGRLKLPEKPGLLVANPPYGTRLELEDESGIAELYGQLAKLCNDSWREWRKGILTPDVRLLEPWGRSLDKLRFRNGGIPVKMVVG